MKGGGTVVRGVAHGGPSPADGSTGTTISGHLCPVTFLAGREQTHGTPGGTVVECPCGKVWQVTKKHLSYGGRRGAVCSCGWKRIA